MKQASPLRNKFRAVIFFYRHLLSPIASSFGSGMLYAARTFLSHLKDASDRPEHCFRHAKVQKTFDTIARFLTFLCIINSTFAYQEVKGVKEVKELRRMSCCLKNYAKKTVVLTPQQPQEAITSLTDIQ